MSNQAFPTCPSCQKSCSQQNSIRAFNQIYHHACFVCEDCQVTITDKYCTMISNNRRLLLCEYHHKSRLNLLCQKCNLPLLKQEEKKFHFKCIQCPFCVTPTASQFEFKGISYCKWHYSQIQETHCAGCSQSILNRFVEHKYLPNQIWHPECYMIYKFWSVKLAPPPLTNLTAEQTFQVQYKMEIKVSRIWTDLSSFVESSANCISDMLLHVATGNHKEGVRMANQFIMHLEVLFNSLDLILYQLKLHQKELDCYTKAHDICQQIIRFFQLLTIKSSNMTQELLSLVTLLAQKLKSLIQVGLEASLHLEREYHQESAIVDYFLNPLLQLEKKRVWISGRYYFKDPTTVNDTNNQCQACHSSIKDSDLYQHQELKWHPGCFQCTTCCQPLNETMATVSVTHKVFCQTCCATGPLNCIYISLFQQYLFQLRSFLFQLSLSSTSSSSSSTLLLPSMSNIDKKKEEPVIALGGQETKRQISILSKLGSAITRTNTDSSVQLKKVQQYNTTTAPRTKSNILTSNIRRTFSSASSASRKRMSFYNIFDGTIKPRRGSALTLNTAVNNKSKYLTLLSSSQDFVVKHVAIITLQPCVSYSMDELVDMMGYKSKRNKTASTTVLWTKLITHIKSNSSKKVFGTPIATLVTREQSMKPKQEGGVTLHDYISPLVATCYSSQALVPVFIKSCCMALFQSDVSIEGVFRKNGNIKTLKLMSESIDTCNTVDLTAENPIQLAALLKRYLRELPEPLMTWSLYPLFVQCSSNIKLLHLVCCLLPKPNRDTMIIVFCCLKWVSSFSDTNKMDIQNLARVIAPNILYSSATTSQHLTQSTQEIFIIETLISQIDLISAIPQDLVLLNIQDTSMVSDLNSRYFIKQYMELLNQQQNNNSSSSSSPTSPTVVTKQRRTSWIPGLVSRK